MCGSGSESTGKGSTYDQLASSGLYEKGSRDEQMARGGYVKNEEGKYVKVSTRDAKDMVNAQNIRNLMNNANKI